MEIFDMAPRTRFVATTKPVKIEIISEPYLVATRLGYAPMVNIRILGNSLEQSLLISSRSLTEALEALRAKNSGKLTGSMMIIQKESNDPKARYIAEPLS